MGEFVFKLPDLGEGTVEAEIAKWHVEAGQVISEDDPLVDMMTDKAAVEVASPVSGKVRLLHGEAGAMMAVGSALVTLDTESEAAASDEAEPAAPAAEPAAAPSAAPAEAPAAKTNGRAGASARGGKVLTSPSIRRLAREQNINLSDVSGSGPSGRILRADVDAFLAAAAAPGAAIVGGPAKAHGTEEIKVIGLRRAIAQRMSQAKRDIPHFSYVDEVDITQLDLLRKHLNQTSGQPRLTYLPLIAAALIRVLKDFPQCNATYDEQRNVIVRHHAVHLGIATQTDDGLKVPVVDHAEALDFWRLASGMRDLTELARSNRASRSQLSGSTITITSLGKLGGIASTPIINAPEVGIIGVNKAVQRPMVIDGEVQIRLMMNLSTSFDHRFVDGYDAAAMVQGMKELLENPAAIFIPAP
ncbi:MAG: dihydrolipoamide acetyltransferase family protein [Pseudomonadota bacterium]